MGSKSSCSPRTKLRLAARQSLGGPWMGQVQLPGCGSKLRWEGGGGGRREEPPRGKSWTFRPGKRARPDPTSKGAVCAHRLAAGPAVQALGSGRRPRNPAPPCDRLPLPFPVQCPLRNGGSWRVVVESTTGLLVHPHQLSSWSRGRGPGWSSAGAWGGLPGSQSRQAALGRDVPPRFSGAPGGPACPKLLESQEHVRS